MPERYRNPPLVELIAELRWGLPFRAAQQPQGALLIAAPGAHEEFFMRFGVQAGLLGYERAERLVPAGFPSMPQQVIYRFRKKPPEEGTSLYQIGTGIFSVNIAPPYDSWEQFRPVVENGVRILLEARIPSEHTTPFAQVSLRYINAFGGPFLNGHTIFSFISEVLGFRVQLPEAIRNEIAPDSEPSATLGLRVPVRHGQQMTLTVAEGLVSGQTAAVFDMTVGTQGPTPSVQSDMMAIFDAANDVAHRVFVNLTATLSEKMGLIKGYEA